MASWKSLKVKLDAELVPLPRAQDAEYDQVIREWELVLSWSVQHGEDEEAVVAREKLVDLRERRDQPRQRPVTHEDRLWSRFRVDPKALQAIADIALASRKEDLDKFREEMLRRPFRLQSMEAPKNPVVGGIDEFQRAEIQWQDRLATQAKLVASDDTRSIGGWAKLYLAKEQQRVNAGELSAGRFASTKASVFYFRGWAGADTDASTITGQTLSRYHAHLLELIGTEKCSATYARDRMASAKTFIRWLWGQDVIEKLPKNIDSRELTFARRTKTPETMTTAEIGTLLRGTTGLNRLCILLGLNCGMTQKDISDLLDRAATQAIFEIIKNQKGY